MKRKYGVLGFVAFLYQFLGVLILLAGLFVLGSAFYLDYFAPQESRIETVTFEAVLLLSPAVGMIISGLLVFGFGQLINLLRDVELNTRRSGHYAAYSFKLQQGRTRAQNKARAAQQRRASAPPVN